jgi:hypothetical protein
MRSDTATVTKPLSSSGQSFSHNLLPSQSASLPTQLSRNASARRYLDVSFSFAVASLVYVHACYVFATTSITPRQDWVRMRWVVDALTRWPLDLGDLFRVENSVFKSPFMFIVTALNINLFSWDQRIECCFYIVFKALLAFGLYAWLRNRLDDTRIDSWLLASLLLGLVFTLAQWDNYLASAGAYSFAVAAFVCLLCMSLCASLHATSKGRFSTFCRYLLLNTLLISSSYTVAALLTIPAVSAYLTWASRKTSRYVNIAYRGAVFSLLAAASLLVYCYVPPLNFSNVSLKATNTSDFVQIIAYAAALIPGGLFHNVQTPAAFTCVVGLLISLLYCGTLVHGALAGRLSVHRSLPISLIIFAIINACIITSGRWPLGLATATAGRYSTFQSLGLIGLVMYWYPMHDENLRIGRGLLLATAAQRMTALVGICLLMNTARYELLVRPYREINMRRLDNVVRTNEQASADDRNLFEADFPNDVPDFLLLLKKKGLAANAFQP